MKLSLMTFSMMMDGMTKTIDADLLCRIAWEAGYEEVDLMEMEIQRLYGKEKMKKALEKYGLSVGSLITSLPFYTAPDTVETALKNALDLAAEFGTKILMVVPGSGDTMEQAACKDFSRQDFLDITVKQFTLICDRAEERGVTVIFENTPHAFKPLSSADDVRYVLDRVPKLRMVFDTGNFRVADKNCDELAAYELLKNRITRIHLKDVRIGDFERAEHCVGGKSIKAVLTGSGVIPMKEIISRSFADGYQGAYAVEYAAPSDTHGAAHIETARTYREIIEAMGQNDFPKCPQAFFPGLTKPVSRIFFGTATMPMIMGANAEYLLDLAMSFGINAIDCARSYGDAEVTIGKWIKARDNREDVVILTKCGNAAPDGSVCVNREVIERELQESLERLQTDYIDIYLLHRDDPKTPVSEFIDTLNEARTAGKIRTFGVSNWTDNRIREANAYAEEKGLQGFMVSSPNYGLVRQVSDPWGGGCVTVSGPENADVRAWYAGNQMPVIAYSSLGRGFMSGKFRSFDYEGAKAVLDPFARRGYLSEDNMERLAGAEKYAAGHGLSVPQTAMRFVLSSPMNVFAVVSMSGFRRMLENVTAASEKMNREDWEKLERIV